MTSESPAPLSDEVLAYKSLDDAELTRRIQAVRDEWGSRLLILGHHYQQDAVIALADLRGDSYKLSELAAANTDCQAIIFCGVHFMAETADILANRPQQLAQRRGQRTAVILPDLTAGCPMADMANIEQVEDCWSQLEQRIDVEDCVPVTYVNSAASLKAFCGRRGGIVCTSANARPVLEWAFRRKRRVLFFPDQHLGRNTAMEMGIAEEEMPLWNPHDDVLGGNEPAAIEASRVILWKGHCCVHQVFLPQHVDHLRQQYPDIKIIVHPECTREVVDRADSSGSTGAIIRAVSEAPDGTRWAIGTEPHLVNRLKLEFPRQEIHYLSPAVRMCATMYRINLPHLCWSAEQLAQGTPVNVVQVDEETAAGALLALQRMLEVK